MDRVGYTEERWLDPKPSNSRKLPVSMLAPVTLILRCPHVPHMTFSRALCTALLGCHTRQCVFTPTDSIPDMEATKNPKMDSRLGLLTEPTLS